MPENSSNLSSAADIPHEVNNELQQQELHEIEENHLNQKFLLRSMEMKLRKKVCLLEEQLEEQEKLPIFGKKSMIIRSVN